MKLSTRLLLTAALAATVSHSAFAAEPLNLNKSFKLKKTTPSFVQSQNGNGASQGSSSSNVSRFNPSLVNKQLTPKFSKSGNSGLPSAIFNPSNGSANTGALNGNLVNKKLIGRTPIKTLTPNLGITVGQNGNGSQNGNGNPSGNGTLNPKISDLIKAKPGLVGKYPIFDPGVVGNPGGGSAADPNQPSPGSADPNQGGGGNPPADPAQPGDPQHDHCPPKDCHPNWPSNCQPHQHCPPCISTIWWPTYTPPVTVVVEQPVVVTPEPQRLQLIVGKPADLALPGLAAAATAAIEVNGVGLPTQVLAVTPERVQIAVPLMGLSRPTPAKLYLFNAEMQPLVEMDVLLVVAPQ